MRCAGGIQSCRKRRPAPGDAVPVFRHVATVVGADERFGQLKRRIGAKPFGVNDTWTIWCQDHIAEAKITMDHGLFPGCRNQMIKQRDGLLQKLLILGCVVIRQAYFKIADQTGGHATIHKGKAEGRFFDGPRGM